MLHAINTDPGTFLLAASIVIAIPTLLFLLFVFIVCSRNQ